MRIRLRSPVTDAAELRAFIERHVRFAFGRVAPAIRDLTVRLADTNGPRGGVDKLCLVSVRLVAGGPDIVVSEVDASLPTAVARAADRSSRRSRALSPDSNGRPLAVRRAPRRDRRVRVDGRGGLTACGGVYGGV